MSLTWKVKRFDCNKQAIIDYDILKYREDFIKRLKKISQNKEEFSERLKSQMMYYYKSKAEHELIVSIDIDKVILSPWCGCKEPEKTKITVFDESFDWFAFAMYHIGRQYFDSKAKIDAFSQLTWKWSEFVDYCWYTKLPYERDNEKFHK